MLLETVFSLNPYFIGLSTLMCTGCYQNSATSRVSILILLDYLLLFSFILPYICDLKTVSILILLDYLLLFITNILFERRRILSQSLFYWIIYSYETQKELSKQVNESLNPYFIGLSTLIF